MRTPAATARVAQTLSSRSLREKASMRQDTHACVQEHSTSDPSDYDDIDDELLALLEDEGPDKACKKPRHEYSPVCSPSPPPRHALRPALGALSALPPEVLFRLLGFLSPEDLTAAAQSCTMLRGMASDDLLWRRLFAARWPRQQPDAAAPHNQRARQHWKAGVGAPAALCDMYERMVTSKRSQRLGRQHALPLLSPSTAQPDDAIAAWRRAHGFDPAGHWDAVHACRVPEWVQVSGSCFVCGECGWAHECGEGCRERQIDARNDLLVCPISGRCFTRLLTNREEEEAAETRGVDHGEDAGDEFSNYGHLARAYLMGYACNTEAELQGVFGVGLR